MRTRTWRGTVFGISLLGVFAMSSCGGGAGAGVEAGSTSVTVNLSPQTVIVSNGGSQRFMATVSGASNTAVTWAVDSVANGNSTVGTVSASGNSVVYTAPASNGTHTLVATSVADNSKSDASPITVQASCAPAPAPLSPVDVKKDYGAKGDGVTDDTSAIQNAVKGTKPGGTVWIPIGTYMVNAANGGVSLKSNMTLNFESGAVLKAIPTGADDYAILSVSGVSNVNIVGNGTLQGERTSHSGSGGEQGHGLLIKNSDQVVVENVTSSDCWGDGFYIGSSATNVTLCNVTANNNRRAGLSITDGNTLTIRASIFENTHGTAPECGLNIEPNAGETVNSVRILGCTFKGNNGTGLTAGVPCALSQGTVTNIEIDGNTAQNNGESGILISRCNGTQVTNNTATSNAVDGISLGTACSSPSKSANDSLISGNTVSNNTRAGILEAYCDSNSIISNSGTGNRQFGIHSTHCSNMNISNNNGLPVTQN